MKAKLIMALVAVFAIATSASADFSISDAGSISGINPSPAGDYLFVPGAGNAAGFVFAGGPFAESTFDGAGNVIGPDFAGADVISSDLVTDNGDGTVNLLLTLTSGSGDFIPAGSVDGAGLPLDTFGLFVGASGGGTPIDFGSGVVISANLDGFVGGIGGTSIFGGPIDLVPIGFDVQSGSLGISFGAGTAGIGLDTITLDINVTKEVIPEPTSMVVLGVLGMGLVARRRR